MVTTFSPEPPAEASDWFGCGLCKTTPKAILVLVGNTIGGRLLCKWKNPSFGLCPAVTLTFNIKMSVLHFWKVPMLIPIWEILYKLFKDFCLQRRQKLWSDCIHVNFEFVLSLNTLGYNWNELDYRARLLSVWSVLRRFLMWIRFGCSLKRCLHVTDQPTHWWLPCLLRIQTSMP